MSAIIENNKVIINLSNTESVSSSIYNYSDLSKTKLSSISSTSSYFLSTNGDVSKKIIDILDCDNSPFIVDYKKTKHYIENIDIILQRVDDSDFHGELRDFYQYRDYYFDNNDDFSIGFGRISIEEGSSGRSYLRFNNDEENVKKFRGIIIALLSSIIIEKRGSKNYIYPEIKKEFINIVHEKLVVEFINYMRDIKKLSESSIASYVDYMDITSNDAIQEGLIEKTLYDYNDPIEVESILETLRANDHFNEITFKRNHINTAAVGNYIGFLNYKYNNIIDEVSDSSKEQSFKKDNNDLSMLLNNLNNEIDKNKKAAILKEIIKVCYNLLNEYR